MKDGIININKPTGMTSNDVIYKMRKILGIKKLGHTGTLDPLATGVLPVCINKGTRVAEYMDIDFKVYVCTMILGLVTDSQDITGKIIASAYRHEDDEGFSETIDLELKKALERIDEIKITDAFEPFKGLIEQVPPMHSAIKINGRKLYDYIYGGNEDEIAAAKKKIKSRQVFIESLEIESIDLDKAMPEVTFSVKCSKGTYIRTICEAVGNSLGCGATLKTLDRVASGVFNIKNSVTLDELYKIAIENGILDEELHSIDKKFHEDIPACFEKYVASADFALEKFGVVIVNSEVGSKFLNGWHISYKEARIVRESTYEPPVARELLRGANPDSEEYNQGSYAGLKVKPEYQRAYKIYMEDGENLRFLGVAMHSDVYKKLVADKVFHRGE